MQSEVRIRRDGGVWVIDGRDGYGNPVVITAEQVVVEGYRREGPFVIGRVCAVHGVPFEQVQDLPASAAKTLGLMPGIRTSAQRAVHKANLHPDGRVEQLWRRQHG